MPTTIRGFHQDELGDWVAELACGHTQHMRHRPPWQERAWVLDARERRAKLGQPIACPLCDLAKQVPLGDMPVLPDDVREYKRTAAFDETSVPAALLADHRTKSGVWARIVVESGELQYSFGEPRCTFTLTPERCGIVLPQVPHQVALQGRVRFHVEFLRAP